MKIRQGLILAPLILIAGYFFMNYLAGFREEPVKRGKPKSLRSVLVAPVKYERQETGLSAFGRLTAAQEAALITEVGGRLEAGEVALREAVRFRKGQLLYKVDDAEARLSLQARKSELLNALSALLADLKIDYAEAFPKWQKFFGMIDVNKPLPEIPEFSSTEEKNFFSNRNVLSLYYAILSQEERLEKYKYYAPFNGAFVTVAREVGSVVTPGAQIANIIQTDRMEAVVPVAADLVGWVSPGVPLALYNQDKSMQWRGVVSRAGNVVDPQTQSVNVYINVFPNGQAPLFEGMFLQAELPGRAVTDAMELPRRALVENNQVYLVENGRLKMNSVNIHKVNEETMLISGLKEGALVVTEALSNASEGMEVKTRQAK